MDLEKNMDLESSVEETPEETKPEEKPVETPEPVVEDVLPANPLPEAEAAATVTLDKDRFDAMMKRIDRLEYAASKAQLSKFDAKNRGSMEKVVKLITFNDLVVISWTDMTKNLVEKDPHGKWFEEQEVQLTMEDGQVIKTPYVVFSRRYQLRPAKVVSEVKDQETQEITFKLKTEEGEEYEIHEKFVN